MHQVQLFLAVLAAVIPGPSRAEAQGSDAYFPPVGEILGSRATPLPTPEAEDLRDAPNALPSFEAELRVLRAAPVRDQREALERFAALRSVRAVPYVSALLLRVNAPLESRVAAAGALGAIGYEPSIDALDRATRDEAKEVRFAAALALGRLRTREAAGVLERVLRHDPHWWVRYAAAVALGETRRPLAAGPLARALREETSWQVRQQAARSLGQIGTADAGTALVRALSDEEPAVRYGAACALADAAGPELFDALVAAYAAEPDPLIRARLRAALSRAARR